MQDLTNPVYLAGKLHYWEGIPSDAISHCAPEIATAWLSGWNDAKAEHLHLQAHAARNRRRVLSEHGDSVL